MRAVLDNHSILKDAVTAITELIDEGVLKFTSQGLEFVSADRAVIAVVAFHMSRDKFKEYEAEEEEMGLNMEDFLRFLKRGKKTDILKMERDENHLVLEFEGRTKRKFKIPLLKVLESEKPPIERITEFKAEITLPGEILEDAVEDGSLISDSLVFIAEEGKLTIVAEGTTKEMTTEIEASEGVVINVQEPSRARYSIEYLKKIMKGSKVGSECKMFFASNYPLKIVFSDYGIRMGYILAPRMED